MQPSQPFSLTEHLSRFLGTLPFSEITPTFRLQSRFLELIHSFGLIQIRFAYALGTIHISAFVYIPAVILNGAGFTGWAGCWSWDYFG